MTNITNDFGTLYHPKKAFLVYQQDSQNKKVYIEGYDIDDNGRPANAHPLSLREAAALAKALQVREKKEEGFLTVKGLLPKNLLYVRTGKNPCAVWHTPAQSVKMLFKADLEIESGQAHIPELVWKANKSALAVYAVSAPEIGADTPLFHAPFFNVYEDGHVCMGSVRLEIAKDCALEDFMAQWQEAFFNSYFSHMVKDHCPVKGNMVQLWKSLSGTGRKFPQNVLIKTNGTLKQLIQ